MYGFLPPNKYSASLFGGRKREKENSFWWLMKTNEYFLISYLTLEEVEEILNSKLKQIERFAFILHDKDVYLDDVIDDTNSIVHRRGDKKVDHVHIYLKLFQSRDSGEIKRWFIKEIDGVRTNCLLQFVYDRCGAVAYLTHRTKKAKDKYQYPLEDVRHFNLDGLEDTANDCVDNTLAIIDDIINGTPIRELIRRYGRTYVFHKKDFDDIVFCLLKENIKNEENNYEIDL